MQHARNHSAVLLKEWKGDDLGAVVADRADGDLAEAEADDGALSFDVDVRGGATAAAVPAAPAPSSLVDARSPDVEARGASAESDMSSIRQCDVSCNSNYLVDSLKIVGSVASDSRTRAINQSQPSDNSGRLGPAGKHWKNSIIDSARYRAWTSCELSPHAVCS